MPILGLKACAQLNLIKKIDSCITGNKEKEMLICKHHKVFGGTGKVPFKYQIKLNDKAVPIASGCRRVPVTIKLKFKLLLDNLVKKDIIIKIYEPLEWVHNVVFVEKANGDLRMCLDLVHLNKYVILDMR